MARYRKDPDYVAPGLHGQLLSMRAGCRHHGGYNANVMRNGVMHGQGCPKCEAEKAWVLKANKLLLAEGQPITEETLVAKAEELAGKRLHRYHSYG